MLWTNQAYEILYLFKNFEKFKEIVPYMLNNIVDK